MLVKITSWPPTNTFMWGYEDLNQVINSVNLESVEANVALYPIKTVSAVILERQYSCSSSRLQAKK